MGKHVVLGVTGSIAAYKAAELVRLMKQEGWEVTVVLTRSGQQFVSELTFRTLSQNRVITDMFQDPDDWKPEHIAVAERADVLVIAPCTANTIAKLSHGLADDFLSCMALACRAPLVIAPAMNEAMWDHPATRGNVDVLRARGAVFVDVGKGALACGVKGRGRMAEPAEILAVATKCMQGPRKG